MSQQPSAVLVRSIDGSIKLWNPAAQSVYGWAPDQAVGKSSHALFRTEFPYSLTEINKQLLESGVWEGELVHTLKDGRKVRVTSRWELTRDPLGDSLTVFEINRDVTELSTAAKIIPFPLSRMLSRAAARYEPRGQNDTPVPQWVWWVTPFLMVVFLVIAFVVLFPAQLPPLLLE